MEPAASHISVVVAAKDEATVLGALLADLAQEPVREVVVVDGGSTDRTADVARGAGARVIVAGACRGAQLHEGAVATSGSLLWFLHADVRAPAGAALAIERTAGAPGFVIGAFPIALISGRASPVHRASLGIIAAAANARARWLGLPYGDAGLFLHRETYDSLGGFGGLHRCEDLDLVLRVHDRGLASGIRLAPLLLAVSARRWDRKGAWRTSAGHVREAMAFVRQRRRTTPR